MMIQEYTSTESLVNTISLPAASYYPFQAVEVSPGILAVCFYGSTTNEVRLMSVNSQTLRSYGSTTPGSGVLDS
jgi:hypothetical protein